MKRFIIAFTLAPLMVSSALANDASTVAVVLIGAAAAGTGAGAAAHYGVLAREADDWKNPDTDTTAVLGRGCDANIEARLLSSNRFNYLFLGVKNEAPVEKILKPREVRVTFENGRERLPAFDHSASDVAIKSGWRAAGLIPLPEKLDFYRQKEIKIDVPLYEKPTAPPCVATVEMRRDPKVHPSIKTHLSYTVFDLNIEFGSSVFRTKNLSDVGDLGFSFVFDMSLYPSPRHGFYLIRVGLENYSGDKFVKVRQANGEPIDTGSHLTGGFLSTGYSHRKFLGSRTILNYDIGPAVYLFNFQENSNDKNGTGESFFAATHKLSFDYRLWRVGYGYFRGDYAIGLSLNHAWIPSGSIGKQDVSGHAVAGLVRFRMGI